MAEGAGSGRGAGHELDSSGLIKQQCEEMSDICSFYLIDIDVYRSKQVILIPRYT